MATRQEGITDVALRNLLDKIKIGEIFSFPELFTDFIFAGGSTMPRYELLAHLKYLFEIAIKQLVDDLALDVLKKIQIAYHIIFIEEEAERKKEQQHFGDSTKRADDKFFRFIISIYSTIICKKKGSGYNDITKSVMQKTRFWMLECASQQWTQEMTDKSYLAFRFLIGVFESQERTEILDKILRPRVENWFKDVKFIEKWILDGNRESIPYEIQQLLVMARAKNGGPELAKKDIANSIAVATNKDK